MIASSQNPLLRTMDQILETISGLHTHFAQVLAKYKELTKEETPYEAYERLKTKLENITESDSDIILDDPAAAFLLEKVLLMAELLSVLDSPNVEFSVEFISRLMGVVCQFVYRYYGQYFYLGVCSFATYFLSCDSTTPSLEVPTNILLGHYHYTSSCVFCL